jgi:hypothetical protein
MELAIVVITRRVMKLSGHEIHHRAAMCQQG